MSKRKIALLILLPLGLAFISLFIGRYPMNLGDTITILVSQIFPITPTWPSTMEAVVMKVRLPRAILSMLIGASLSVSGASFQGMFKNPLVWLQDKGNPNKAR